MSLLLGIDTSGLAGSVALSQDGVALEHRSLEQAGRRHAQTLIAEISALLTAHQFQPKDLSAVGVIHGPGSFTGLRVGVVCAKTLSYSLRIPLITVDTFDVIAAQCPSEFSAVWIVDDAQRQELYAGRYQRTERDGWRLQGERFIVPARDWLASLSKEDVVVGPGTQKLPSDITAPQIVNDPAVSLPRAETVCRLAARRFAAGAVDDCWTALPFYIRVSGAEEKAAKTAGVARPESSKGAANVERTTPFPMRQGVPPG